MITFLKTLFTHRRIIADLPQTVREKDRTCIEYQNEILNRDEQLQEARRQLFFEIGNNQQMAQTMRVYDVLIQKQQVALNAAGLSKYALPPIACLLSVYPELFPPKHAKPPQDNSAAPQSLTNGMAKLRG